MALNITNNNIVNLQSINTATSKVLKNNPAAEVVNQAINVALRINANDTAGALKGLGELFQASGNLVTAGALAQPPLPSSVAKLFGNNVLSKVLEEINQKGKPSSTATSLGALLAQLGGILGKAMEATMSQLTKSAKQLDNLTSAGGPTAAMNQKIQELTFNLQQVQQTVNRINETITNLSRSLSDAQKSSIQNLTV